MTIRARRDSHSSRPEDAFSIGLGCAHRVQEDASLDTASSASRLRVSFDAMIKSISRAARFTHYRWS